MRIVNLKTFRSLPINTLAMKYEPCIFGDLFVKGETWEHDFLLENITNEIESGSSDDMTDKLFMAEKKGDSVKMNFDAIRRDGMMEDRQLFAIWEKEDIKGLIAKLNKCLESYDI